MWDTGVYYESLRLSQHGWPCGPPGGRLSMMVVYYKISLDNQAVHYALMPVWQYLYRYKGKTYQYHVNGQTGKVIQFICALPSSSAAS